MDQKLLADFWNKLADRRADFVRVFYNRLFERFPQYRQLFPPIMDPQMEKMIETISSVIQLLGYSDRVRAYLVELGVAHRAFGINKQDFENFKTVFIDAMAETCPEIWQEDYKDAFEKAFDDAIIPMMCEGLGI